jgi:hypothetical protein
VTAEEGEKKPMVSPSLKYGTLMAHDKPKPACGAPKKKDKIILNMISSSVLPKWLMIRVLIPETTMSCCPETVLS